jgi:hypothetical protein
MISTLVRKGRQVWTDPVLRRWILRRAVGLEPAPPSFTAGRPPYLPSLDIGRRTPTWQGPRPARPVSEPAQPLRVMLAGSPVEIAPDSPGAMFDRRSDDIETELAAHRFAWLPIAGAQVDPAWVAALWAAWLERHAEARTGWAWHAYTAAERAINILDYAQRHGLPGAEAQTLTVLAGHAEAIASSLEYFGDHYTSNHLSNNGRGLLRIGTALGMDGTARLGARIMTAEAGRIFGQSGVLREGSTHYHLLVTRNYIDAWLDAKSAGLEQAGMLRDVAERAVAAIPGLCLPGGLPLIGDISPDVSPAYLGRLCGGAADSDAWPAHLPDDRQKAAHALIEGAAGAPISPDKLAEDGWHRFGDHQWHALVYVPPDGWPPMPGHGHHDLSGFELHDGDVPVIVDPGRGSYCDPEYAGAELHSGVTIDGARPTPLNRPYYTAAFRARIVGARPDMSRTQDGRILRHAGFSRLPRVGAAEREWRLLDDRVEILDRIDGRGRHRISWRFFTAADVQTTPDGIALTVADATYRLSSAIPATVSNAVRWREYGHGDPGRLVEFDHVVKLPYEFKTIIERF